MYVIRVYQDGRWRWLADNLCELTPDLSKAGRFTLERASQIATMETNQIIYVQSPRG